MPGVPHPIPYQGSKRLLAPRILAFVPERVATFYEPFAGSAALSLAVAARRPDTRIVLGDSLPSLVAIWQAILRDPHDLARRYEALWQGQRGQERAFYDEVRDAFNARPSPEALLFLLARCVKNSVRFNQSGAFNQSPDRRRRGTAPDRMRRALLGAAALLGGRASAEVSDYEALLERATPDDLVYMDPPYEGTSQGRDHRYHQGLDRARFVAALGRLRERGVPFLVSFDGRLGERTYGSALPAALGLRRLELPAGRSSQATLLGRGDRTVESLYLSPELAP